MAPRPMPTRTQTSTTLRTWATPRPPATASSRPTPYRPTPRSTPRAAPCPPHRQPHHRTSLPRQWVAPATPTPTSPQPPSPTPPSPPPRTRPSPAPGPPTALSAAPHLPRPRSRLPAQNVVYGISSVMPVCRLAGAAGPRIELAAISRVGEVGRGERERER